jgi:hypothetical protein
MIRRVYRMLPGPTSLRIAQAVVLSVLVLVALHFFYSWLGNVILDNGGAIG